MPLYLVGNSGSSIIATDRFSGWEAPVSTGDNQNFRVSYGSFTQGTLEVAIAPVDDYGVLADFDPQLPPVYTEVDPASGLFKLADFLPNGWQMLVKYVFH